MQRDRLQRGAYFVEVVRTLAENAQTPINLGKGRQTERLVHVMFDKLKFAASSYFSYSANQSH